VPLVPVPPQVFQRVPRVAPGQGSPELGSPQVPLAPVLPAPGWVLPVQVARELVPPQVFQRAPRVEPGQGSPGQGSPQVPLAPVLPAPGWAPQGCPRPSSTIHQPQTAWVWNPVEEPVAPPRGLEQVLPLRERA
jgi:hypothetical protein